MEELVKLKVSETTTIEKEVLSSYKYSPGVLLGPFNLIGWSSDDIERRWNNFGEKLFLALLTVWAGLSAFILGPMKVYEWGVQLYQWFLQK